MEKISVIEIMKSEVCHSHKGNCDICPILEMCKDGRVDALVKEFKDRDEYCVVVEQD